MLTSPNHVIGRACLCSLAQLASTLGQWDERNAKAHEGVRHTLRTYASPVRCFMTVWLCAHKQYLLTECSKAQQNVILLLASTPKRVCIPNCMQNVALSLRQAAAQSLVSLESAVAFPGDKVSAVSLITTLFEGALIACIASRRQFNQSLQSVCVTHSIKHKCPCMLRPKQQSSAH